MKKFIHTNKKVDAIGKQLYFYSQPALVNRKTILEYYQVTSLGFTIYMTTPKGISTK